MCTILLRLDPGADEPVVLAANRDEFRSRAADDPAAIAPGVFAGRDRQGGGTWLALGRAGVAAITNVAATARSLTAPSRGALPLAALRGELPRDYRGWNAFNLLVIGREGTYVVTHVAPSEQVAVAHLGPGEHVIVNQPFGVACPRTLHAAALLRGRAPDFDLLADHGRQGSDGLCHHGAEYGTVSSTVLALDHDFRVTRYWHRGGLPCAGVSLDLTGAARSATG